MGEDDRQLPGARGPVDHRDSGAADRRAVTARVHPLLAAHPPVQRADPPALAGRRYPPSEPKHDRRDALPRQMRSIVARAARRPGPCMSMPGGMVAGTKCGYAKILAVTIGHVV